MGLLRLITNEKVMGREVLSQRQAWHVYDTLCADNRVAYLDEPADVEGNWGEYSSSSNARTKEWTDAYLGAFARARGLRVITFDKGFRSFPALELFTLE